MPKQVDNYVELKAFHAEEQSAVQFLDASNALSMFSSSIVHFQFSKS